MPDVTDGKRKLYRPEDTNRPGSVFGSNSGGHLDRLILSINVNTESGSAKVVAKGSDMKCEAVVPVSTKDFLPLYDIWYGLLF